MSRTLVNILSLIGNTNTVYQMDFFFFIDYTFNRLL